MSYRNNEEEIRDGGYEHKCEKMDYKKYPMHHPMKACQTCPHMHQCPMMYHQFMMCPYPMMHEHMKTSSDTMHHKRDDDTEYDDMFNPDFDDLGGYRYPYHHHFYPPYYHHYNHPYYHQSFGFPWWLLFFFI